MEWMGNEISVQDLYEQVQEIYNVDQPLGDITMGIVKVNISKALDIDKSELANAQTFGQIISYIRVCHPYVYSQERTPEQIDNIKRGFASIVKLSRIKPR